MLKRLDYKGLRYWQSCILTEIKTHIGYQFQNALLILPITCISELFPIVSDATVNDSGESSGRVYTSQHV